MHPLLSSPKTGAATAPVLDAIEAALLAAYQAHDWSRSTRTAIDQELFANKPKRRATFTRRQRAGA